MATITSLNFAIRSSWDGTALNKARDDLMALQAQMRTISGASLHFTVDADTEEAKAKIAELRAQARDIQMGIDLNDGQLATAEAKLDILARDREVDVRVNDHDIANKMDRISDSFENASVSAVDFGNSSNRAGFMAKVGIAAFAAGLVVLPGLINLVGASLTGAMGGGIIAVGALALKENEQMKAGWEALWTEMKSTAQSAAQPMLQPFLDTMSMAKTRIAELKPELTDLFASAAPAIQPLTSGLMDLVTNAMPGLTQALEQSGPMVQGFADGLGSLGTHVSNMFAGMADGAAGFGRLWKITFDQVGLMMEQFGVAAGKMSETGTDLWDRLLTGFNQFIGGFLDGLVDFTAAVDNGVGDALSVFGLLGDVMRGTLGPLGELVAAISNALMPVLDGTVQALTPVIGALMSGLAPAINSLVPLSNALQPLLVMVGQSLTQAINQLAPLLPPIVDALVSALIPAFQALIPALVPVIEQIAVGLKPLLEMLPGVINTLSPIVVGLAIAFGQITQWLSPLIPHLMQMYVAWKLISTAMAIGRGIMIAYTAVRTALTVATIAHTAAVWANNIAMSANPIGLIIIAIGALVAAIVWLATKTQFFQTVWEALKVAMAAVWNWMKDAWDATVGFLAMRWEQFSGTIVNAWNATWNVIKVAAQAVWGFLTNAWNQFLTVLKVTWEVVSGVIKAAWDVWWFAIRASVAIIWAWLEVAWGALWGTVRRVWDSFVAIFQPLWDGLWNGVKVFVEGVWGGIQILWDGLWKAVTAGWNAFMGWLRPIWESFWNTVKQVGESIWNAVKLAWEFLWDQVKQKWDWWVNLFNSVWQPFWNGIKAAAETVWNGITSAWNAFWNGIKAMWENFSNAIRAGWEAFWNWVRDFASGVWDAITSKWGEFKQKFEEVFSTMVDKAREIWDKIREVFAKPINFVIRIWNDHVAGKFGLPALDEIGGFATGGRVDGKGTGTSDDIPARLSRGEHVWTAKEVDAAGGHGNVEAMRRNTLNGVAHYASGGPVEWMIGQQQKFAPALQVTSAQRDSNDYHGQGKAVDFSNGGDAGTPEMMAFANWIADTWGANTLELIHSPFGRNIKDGNSVGDGMGFYGAGTMAQHRNHVHWAVDRPLNEDEGGQSLLGKIWGGVRKGIAWTFEKLTNPILGAIPDPFLPGVGSPFAGFPKAAATKVRDAFLDKVRGAEGASGGTASGDIGGVIPDGDRLGIINEALRITNTPPPSSIEAWQRGMNTLITRESGWNAGAINNWDSNAAAGNASRGLAQVIPTTFEAHKAPGYNNIDAPVDNVAASINYIKSRYGTIENVQQANANMAPQGYRTGTNSAAAGWHLVGEDGPEMVNFRGGEQVKTFDDIIRALKDSTSGQSKELESKLTAEIRTLVEKIGTEVNTSGARFAQSVEQAIERVLATAGMQLNLSMPVPQNAADAAAYAQEVANQLLPQLEMMIRQRIGTR
ncbi:tape measure protein [Rhodococcus phage REQ1]|uniref:tail length tape measure protein n=1 Tax=Rhodococcus phage REQ1 TaxID=1109712 RepID=UPI00023EEC70|nr:tail length tape measure protein [Rhodococcus phage REQ1]AEV52074.1 tape measure protein [Rhodococcus phage REQ1]